MHPFHALFHNPQKFSAYSHDTVGEYGGIDLEDGIAELGVVGHQPGGGTGISTEELAVLRLHRNDRYVLLTPVSSPELRPAGMTDWRLWA